MIFNFKDINIYYEDYGIKSETPILFLHGWEGSHKSFKFFSDKLSTKHRCINLDFPPFNNSSMPTNPLTVNDYSDMIFALLSFLKIEKVHIVAHSFGGRVAINLATKTNVVESLLLTGCAGIKKKSIKRFFKVLKYKFLKLLVKFKLFPRKKLESYGSSEYKKLNPVMKQTFKNIVNYDQTKLLKKIIVPTLLVWGTCDKETPFYFTKIFKKNIKDCEVIEFENCSHFAYLEKPKLFLDILFSYFN